MNSALQGERMAYELLQSQKNELFALIKESGIEHFNFIWRITKRFDGSPMLCYSHNDTEYFYIFSIGSGGHFACFSPAYDRISSECITQTWGRQKQTFQQWLVFLKREIDSPDLWGALAKVNLPPELKTKADFLNEPFTARESDNISRDIKTLESYFVEQGWAKKEQIDIVNQKLDYLIENTKKQSRKDWFFTGIGILVSIITTLALSQEQGNYLFHYFKTMLSGIIPFLSDKNSPKLTSV